METRDLACSSTEAELPLDLDERWRIGIAIRILAEIDSEVHALTVRVTHLLDPPSVLSRPDIVERANDLTESNNPYQK
jgi:hypothetical protein